MPRVHRRRTAPANHDTANLTEPRTPNPDAEPAEPPPPSPSSARWSAGICRRARSTSGPAATEPVLRVRGLSRAPAVDDVSLNVHRGEILGVFGLVGSGRSELLETIFGLHAPDRGDVFVGDTRLPGGNVLSATRAGVALVPEDRQRQALLFNLALRHNLVLPRATTNRSMVMRSAEERAFSADLLRTWQIRAPGHRGDARPPERREPAESRARALAGDQPLVFLLDEPTKGVDVGAKDEIHEIIRRKARDGAACLVVSSDLPEILALAHRILVMREGRVQGELARRAGRRGSGDAARDRPGEAGVVKRLARLLRVREGSTLAILLLEIVFFGWYLWPESGSGYHPFLNGSNALLVLKYSSIYGIAAIGAAIVIIAGGINLSPGAVIALASVVTGGLMVEGGWSLAPSILAGLLVGIVSGLLISLLVITVQLPPFIATLGAMGIVRGAGFILTEGRYFDVSRVLAPGWRPLGIPLDWWPPAVMVVLALAFQLGMHRLQWGRAVYSVGGNETAALFSGISLGRIKTSVYLISATLAAVSGVVLVLVQGQGKADLAMGYELDIIASAVVGGASLSGGRGSVIGAVLGALIFGVLRNALAQIPGATFYDRLIVGVVVIAIVVMDQILVKRGA